VLKNEMGRSLALAALLVAALLGGCGGGGAGDGDGAMADGRSAPEEAAEPRSAPEESEESAAPVAAAADSAPGEACDPSYPDFCIPGPPPDLDCDDVEGKKPFQVRRPDPHNFDRDGDGRACEPNPRRDRRR
jgi:hypothetical protein